MNYLEGHAMDHKKIADQQTGTDKRRFFRFVDKNPLFRTNTKATIQEYILSTRRARCVYKPHLEGSCESPADYLTAGHFQDRDK
jgi:hypothetical protein